MAFYLGLNRRSGGDRRVLDRGGEVDRRPADRRRPGTDRYVLVLGYTGIDRFGLTVGFPMVLLLAGVLIGTFAHG